MRPRGCRPGIKHGYTGLLVGFTAGHVLLFSLLYGQILREFPPVLSVRFGWLKWAWRYMPLVAASALANLAIWSDKLVFWFSSSVASTMASASWRSDTIDLRS